MRDKLGRFIKGNHVITEFKPGHIPWHKGMKGLCLNTGRTQFKKGEISDEKHPMWKGNNVSYSALHHWIKRKLGKPNYCGFCRKKEKGMYHWANLSRVYMRDLHDWISLCVSCHKKYDLHLILK